MNGKGQKAPRTGMKSREDFGLKSQYQLNRGLGTDELI